MNKQIMGIIAALACSIGLLNAVTFAQQQSGVGGPGQTPGGPSPVFAPGTWAPGDTWEVKFTYSVDMMVADLSEPDTAIVDRFYKYTVQPDTTDEGYLDIAIAKILVEPQLGGGDWLLTFDRDLFALIRIERLHSSGGRSVYKNPFYFSQPLRFQSWMSMVDDFGATIIHDFPRLLGPDGPASVIVPAMPGNAPFDQDMLLQLPTSGPRLRTTFTRVDPVSNLAHETRIFWEQGAKWWSSATIKLDGELLITGTLLP